MATSPKAGKSAAQQFEHLADRVQNASHRLLQTWDTISPQDLAAIKRVVSLESWITWLGAMEELREAVQDYRLAE